MEDRLAEAVSHFEIKNYNKALSLFKQILKEEPSNETAMYYACLVYRTLKKWEPCKRLAHKYMKKHGQNWKLLEILGDAYEFEGHFKKARSFFKASIKSIADEKERQRVLTKLQNCEMKALEARKKPKVALIVAEGEDSFTDDLLERLSEHFWIKKFVIQRPVVQFYGLLCRLAKETKKPLLCSALGGIFPSKLKMAISWASVVWVEWFSQLAVLASYIPKAKDKKYLLDFIGTKFLPIFLFWQTGTILMELSLCRIS